MNLITAWIYSHLEKIFGFLSGLSVITLDIPDTILKLLLAVVLGFLGATGAGLYKILEAKLKKK